MSGRHCRCGAILGAKNTKGRCPPCNIRALSADPEVVARRAKTFSENRIGWCPLEYRSDYFRMNQNQGIPAAQARKIIEEQMAADAGRYARTGKLQQSRRSA